MSTKSGQSLVSLDTTLSINGSARCRPKNANRCDVRICQNLSIARSCRRSGWYEFSARLFARRLDRSPSTQRLRIWAANIGSNRLHQNRTIS